MQQREINTFDDQHGQGNTAGVRRRLLVTFEQCLQKNGVIGALAFLNERTRFRFTGLYRVVPPKLHNVSLFDRENPSLNVSGAVRELVDSYCSIVCDSGAPLTIDDSVNDSRVAHHPKRDAIQSYAGVPVRQTGGRVLGSLCHFDGRPRLLPPGELAVLTSVAPLLAAWIVAEG